MARNGIDLAIGTGAMSLPLWAIETQQWAVWIAAVGGAALVVYRLALVILHISRGGRLLPPPRDDEEILP